MRAYAVLMKRFNAEDVWGEVTMREYDVLYTLSKCDSPLRMSELNRHVLLSQPALSKHLRVLEAAGLIESARDAQRRPRRLRLQPLENVAEWMEPFRILWERRLDNLERHLADTPHKEK